MPLFVLEVPKSNYIEFPSEGFGDVWCLPSSEHVEECCHCQSVGQFLAISLQTLIFCPNDSPLSWRSLWTFFSWPVPAFIYHYVLVSRLLISITHRRKLLSTFSWFDPIWDIKRHVQRQAKDLVARVPPVDSQYLEHRHDLRQELGDIAVFRARRFKKNTPDLFSPLHWASEVSAHKSNVF